MGVSQTKRTQAVDNTVAVNAQSSFVITSEDPCNIHGLMLDLMVGQISTGLTFGYWAMFLKPRSDTNVPVLNTTNINAESFSAITWMQGTWMTDDAGVISHIGGAPKSSRNCPRGGALVLVVANSALSGSTVRIHGTITWFETIK